GLLLQVCWCDGQRNTAPGYRHLLLAPDSRLASARTSALDSDDLVRVGFDESVGEQGRASVHSRMPCPAHKMPNVAHAARAVGSSAKLPELVRRRLYTSS